MENLIEIKNKILNEGLTMLPEKTLENIEFCIRECVKNNIEGDYIECGVWKGGAVIYANEVLKSLKQNRKVFVADSFEGLPKPDPKHPLDNNDNHWTLTQLAISLEDVQNHFKLFGDLTDNVVFLKGWFKDTLPKANIDKLCVLRLDGDMYGSTIDTLENLYSKLSIGGYCIIDDYGHHGAYAAVHDYRNKNNITDEIIIIDPRPGQYPSCYWVKTK